MFCYQGIGTVTPSVKEDNDKQVKQLGDEDEDNTCDKMKLLQEGL